MSEHPATMPSARKAHPVRTAPRWGLSPLDCKAHAIDENAEHPYGVYIADCGHRLLMGTDLHDEAPDWMCLSCLRRSGQPHPRREHGEEEHVATRVTDQPRTPTPVQVSVQGTPTTVGAACTLLAIHDTGGTWMIHSLNAGAVRLTEEHATRMVTAILYVAARADHTARGQRVDPRFGHRLSAAPRARSRWPAGPPTPTRGDPHNAHPRPLSRRPRHDRRSLSPPCRPGPWNGYKGSAVERGFVHSVWERLAELERFGCPTGPID